MEFKRLSDLFLNMYGERFFQLYDTLKKPDIEKEKK